MKKLFFLLFALALLRSSMAQQNVGINNPSPDASAVLDIAATDKGLLIPRLTEAQRLAITAPATGLMVFQTDASVGFWYYVSTGGWTFLSPVGDNLGNHTLTQNLNTNGQELVGGSFAGVKIAADGLVSVGSEDRALNGALSNEPNNIGLRLNQADAGIVVTGKVGTNNFSAGSDYEPRFSWLPSNGSFKVGYAAVTNWNPQQLGSFSTSFGYNTVARGALTTAMGFNTIASGWYSTVMGGYVESGGQGAFTIGDRSTSTRTYNSFENSMMMRFAGGYRLWTNSNATIGAYLAAGQNAWNTFSDSTLKENFAPVNGEDFLRKIAGFKLSSWNYKGQNSDSLRHYGPMAQDMHAAFGRDAFGIIGNDTTINQADFDGINLIAIQALEKRTAELKKENEALKKQLLAFVQDFPEKTALEKENELLKARFTKMENEVAEIKTLLNIPNQKAEKVKTQISVRN